jgi:2-keto-3-deoxy-L-rhamnonate aldolase RhmA
MGSAGQALIRERSCITVFPGRTTPTGPLPGEEYHDAVMGIQASSAGNIMRANGVKRGLRAGGVSLGTMVFEFSSTGIARLAASAGAEFVIYDMEHTGWSIETIRGLMATARCALSIPLVRVPAAHYHFVARVLDTGAMGVMVPMVESAEQAHLIAQSAKYPPVGRRGAAFAVAHDDYEIGSLADTMISANAESLLIAQVETVAGLEKVEEIAAVEGIDVLWVGQFDLTNSLGIPGQFGHPRLQEALDRVVAVAGRHGKTAAILVMSVDEGKAMLARGFRCIAYGGDLWLYQQALRQGIAALRS